MPRPPLLPKSTAKLLRSEWSSPCIIFILILHFCYQMVLEIHYFESLNIFLCVLVVLTICLLI